MGQRRWGLALGLSALSLAAGCASVPLAPTIPPVVSFEEKVGWMMRLEDQRILRDANQPPPAILVPATNRLPAIVAPPPPSDLLRLLTDTEARVRRRAALAVGRVGLPDSVEPLSGLLASDAEPEVRQMAAFALGLIGDRAARPALTLGLKDAEPMVQGRAAEALGNIGDRADAGAVAEMTVAHVKAGALAGLSPDDLSYPLTPVVEAARIGLYALVRLGSYDAIAAAVLDPAGTPVSNWWPVAYALQRPADPRAVQPLVALLATAGRYTAAFAARGLGVIKAEAGAAPLRQIITERRAHPAVVIEAIRALAAIGDTAAAPVLRKIFLETAADTTLRLEALNAFSRVATADALDLFIELLIDPSPAVRGLAMRAIARLDPATFLATLSGLDADRDWTVRVAQAMALGTIPPEMSLPRLTLMLQDSDQRVIPSVLAAAKAPGADQLLLDRLKADDVAVRAAAASGLAEMKVSRAVPALLDAYRGFSAENTYVARAAAVAAAARIDPAAARPVLEEALHDRDWAIRVRAASLLREQGVTTADPVRPATGGRAVTPDEWGTLVNPRFSPHAYIETDRGTIEIELAILDAPLTAANFMALARSGFYDGNAIHRVVSDFVVQAGDPRGDGEGGPGYSIRDELNERPYLRGTVGMALDWKDTGGSQFFITQSPQPHLDGRYTAFGYVVSGMDVVDRIEPWDVIRSIRIWDGITPQ